MDWKYGKIAIGLVTTAIVLFIIWGIENNNMEKQCEEDKKKTLNLDMDGIWKDGKWVDPNHCDGVPTWAAMLCSLGLFLLFIALIIFIVALTKNSEPTYY